MRTVTFKLVSVDGKPPYKLIVQPHQVVCIEDLDSKTCLIMVTSGFRYKVMHSAEEVERALIPTRETSAVLFILGSTLVMVGALFLCAQAGVILTAGVIILYLSQRRSRS